MTIQTLIEMTLKIKKKQEIHLKLDLSLFLIPKKLNSPIKKLDQSYQIRKSNLKLGLIPHWT